MSDEVLPIIVGEAPSKSGDKYHDFPLSGAVGEKLCTMAGLTPDERGSRYGRYYWALREAFDCTNLIERYPGAQGSGAAFPMDVARTRCLELRPMLEGSVVVLLGARLNQAFGWAWCGRKRLAERHFEWVTVESEFAGLDTMFVVIPHPSGLNRLYNAEETKASAGAALTAAVFFSAIRSVA